jgi:hypothetical protein
MNEELTIAAGEVDAAFHTALHPMSCRLSTVFLASSRFLDSKGAAAGLAAKSNMATIVISVSRFLCRCNADEGLRLVFGTHGLWDLGNHDRFGWPTFLIAVCENLSGKRATAIGSSTMTLGGCISGIFRVSTFHQNDVRAIRARPENGKLGSPSFKPS